MVYLTLLQSFVLKDDAYRNQRLKFVPSLAEGPPAVRMLAPAKKEYLIDGSFLSVSWKKHEREVRDGRALQPAMECILDCMGNRAVRAATGIVKRNLQKLAIDVAAVVHAEGESPLCLGMWRFDHVDLTDCPDLPDRYEGRTSCDDCDVLRASRLVRSGILAG